MECPSGMMLIAESGTRLGYARVSAGLSTSALEARAGVTHESLFAGVRESQDSMVDRKAAGVRTCHCPWRYARESLLTEASRVT